MNYTKASCGCDVIAVGAPGSMARYAVERRPCDKPRCRSRLPEKFSDAECEAYCHLSNRGARFLVDLLDKSVIVLRDDDTEIEFASLIEVMAA